MALLCSHNPALAATLCLAIFVLGSRTSDALIIASGADNTAAPPGDADFADAMAHVSPTQLANGTYLGHGVVLGVSHQAVKKVSFAGRTYQLDGAPRLTLQQPGSKKSADLQLTRMRASDLAPSAELATLPIITQSPALGTPVRMVSGGYQRGEAVTWTDPERNATFRGFAVGPPRGKQVLRWGENKVEVVDKTMGGGGKLTTGFLTVFNDPQSVGGMTHEAQGSGWDSGGAVFVQNPQTRRWELAGILLSASKALPTQPDPRTGQVLYDITGNFIADLSLYRDQIIRFMVTPKSERTGEVPLEGRDLTARYLADATVLAPGSVALTFTEATNLKIAANYHTVYPDLREAYLHKDVAGFTTLDFPKAGGTAQLWSLEAIEGSFTGGLTLTFEYDAALLAQDVAEQNLRVYQRTDEGWQVLETQVDAEANTATVTVERLGTFGLGMSE